MNRMPIISVIVPIYKVELYLRQCIDSIIAQTYINLEIILVDDGSPDNCGLICDEYAEKDDRIIVVHKENGGVSDARNAGLDIASGEYLTFIDSDDWIELDTIEFLYNNLINNTADISSCSYFITYIDYKKTIYNNNEILILDRQQAITEFFLDKKLQAFLCGKLYKKQIFDNIRLPIGKLYEDLYTVLDIFLEANRYVVCPIGKYYYRQRKSSIVHENYNSKMLDLVEAAEKNLKIIENNYPSITPLANAGVLKANLNVLSRIVLNINYEKIPEYKLIILMLRNNFKFMLKSLAFTKNEKIKIIAIKINMKLYRVLQTFNNSIKNNNLFN